MSGDKEEILMYLLVDNGLLQEGPAAYDEADERIRPVWLEPIYGDRALEVSPLLIDVEAAHEAGDIEHVMRYLNARRPALHVSVIESELNLAGVAQHLRRFIFVTDPEEKQFTLRFADCVVLDTLPIVLTSAQWTTMRGPIVRWGIHDRSGSIVHLRLGEVEAHVPTPLNLDREQLAALDEASEPDRFIAIVKTQRQGESFPGNAVEQHAWAKSARQIWRAENNENSLILEILTEAALRTRGKVLHVSEMKGLLKIVCAEDFQEKLREVLAGMDRFIKD